MGVLAGLRSSATRLSPCPGVLKRYMGVDYHSALGDGFEEIEFGEGSFVGEVEEAHVFEEKRVHASFRGGFELHFLQQLGFESN
jgi:hypothetical protein